MRIGKLVINIIFNRAEYSRKFCGLSFEVLWMYERGRTMHVGWKNFKDMKIFSYTEKKLFV